MSDEIKQKADAVRLQLLEHLWSVLDWQRMAQGQTAESTLANINSAAEVLNKLDVVRLDAGYLADGVDGLQLLQPCVSAESKPQPPVPHVPQTVRSVIADIRGALDRLEAHVGHIGKLELPLLSLGAKAGTLPSGFVVTLFGTCEGLDFATCSEPSTTRANGCENR